MKTHNLGKMKNIRKVREAKESNGKLRKVSAEETPKAKTHKDLHLAIAEMLHNRHPYNEIAKKLKVSPKTISEVQKMMDEGTIKIAENGKAMYNRNSVLMELGSFPKQLQMELLGAAHLEGKSPQDVIADLILLDRKIRLRRLKLDQLEPAVEFLEKAYSRGWDTDPLLDVMTRLADSDFLDLDQKTINILPRFLEVAKSRNLNPEHIIAVTLRTKEKWRKITQQCYNNGCQDGIKHFKDLFVDLIVQAYKSFESIYPSSLASLIDQAEQKALEDAKELR